MYLAMNNDQQSFTEIENLAKEYPYDMRYLTILGDVYPVSYTHLLFLLLFEYKYVRQSASLLQQ